MNKNLSSTLVWVGALAVLLIAAFAAMKAFKPSASSGQKTINVTVVHKDGSENDFTVGTDEEYLRRALEQIDLIDGEESQYGLFIQTVDGETADESNQEWWCVTKGGEMCSYGVDEQPIADGESYELTLMTGWD